MSESKAGMIVSTLILGVLGTVAVFVIYLILHSFNELAIIIGVLIMLFIFGSLIRIAIHIFKVFKNSRTTNNTRNINSYMYCRSVGASHPILRRQLIW